MSQGVKPSSSSRSNGPTTLRKKQLGKVKTFFVLTIQTSCCHREGMYSPTKSQVEISVRREGCSSYNASTIPHYVIARLE
jgi:hypothetical protein